MNHNAAVYMETRRPTTRTRTVVYSPTKTKRHRRAEMLVAAFDGICYFALMVCLVIAVAVLMAVV
ncbi:MAG: hypothetical protein IJP11_02630 [Oscillospiraceae bacterium]|nr:hypothetical protein [Oscillospiraceae bacterium]